MSRLEAQAVSFSWPGRGELLSEVSLFLGAGRIIAILGANGAGKTSLLSVLAGRLRPNRGRVLVEGTLLSSLSPREIARRIAFLPQIERLPFNYPVLDFVLLGRAPHIPPFASWGGGLSAARRTWKSWGRRTGERGSDTLGRGIPACRIARCLAQEAEILLLDEPSALLDPPTPPRWLDSFQPWRKAGNRCSSPPTISVWPIPWRIRSSSYTKERSSIRGRRNVSSIWEP